MVFEKINVKIFFKICFNYNLIPNESAEDDFCIFK